jgi:outer membrane protein assembly factor BamA
MKLPNCIPAPMLIILLLLLFMQQSHTSVKVFFEGNSYYSDSELKEQFGLVDELEMVSDARKDFFMKLNRLNLETKYHQEGFFNATVSLTDSLDAQSKTKLYYYTILENPRFVFGEVSVIIPSWSHDLINETSLETYGNPIYDVSLISEDIQKIKTTYWKNGYLKVRVDYQTELDTNAHRVQLRYDISPGAQAKMGELFITCKRSGNWKHLDGRTDTTHLRSLWTMKHSEVIDGNFIPEFRSKIYATRIFSQVLVQDSLNATTGLTDVFLNVTERPPGQNEFGFFFDPTIGPGISGQSRYRNINGHFHEGLAHASLAAKKQELTLGYANPMLWGTKIRFIPTAIRLDSRVIFEHEVLPPPAFPDSINENYKATQHNDLSFGISDNIRYRFSTSLSRIEDVTEQESKNTFKYETGLDFVYTNRVVDPNKGIRFKPTIGNGGRLGRLLEEGLSDHRYWYTQIQTRTYLPPFSWLTLAFAYDFGMFFSKGIQEDAQAFYQGGPRSVRGWRNRSIFPEIRSIDSATGEEVLQTGLTPIYHRFAQEVRFNLGGRLDKFQIVQFFDYARVQDANAKFQTGTGAALGLGLRYQWEILTIRLDYTFKKQFENMWELEPFNFSTRFSFDLNQAI